LGVGNEVPEFLRELRDRAVNDPVFTGVFEDIPEVLDIVKDPGAYAAKLMADNGISSEF